MGRAKVDNKLIESLKSRNNTFFKRTKGLKKKASELATLCGVDVCMIWSGPQGNQQCKPMTWPDDSQEFSRIIKRYQGASNEEKDRRKLDLMGLLKERNKKAEDELNKRVEERADIMYHLWDDQLNNMTEDMLRSLLVKLDAKMETVNRKIKMLERKGSSQTKEISVDISTQTNPDQLQMMLYGKNQLIGSNFMQLQPIQPYPISLSHMSNRISCNQIITTRGNNFMQLQPIQPYPTSFDLSHMSTGISCNQITPTYANTNLLLAPTEGCFGNQEFGMLDNSYMLQSQVQSCDLVCCDRCLQLQPSFMGSPCLSLLPTSFNTVPTSDPSPNSVIKANRG